MIILVISSDIDESKKFLTKLIKIIEGKKKNLLFQIIKSTLGHI